MFWTDYGQIPKIERATLSGTQRVTIVTLDLTWPHGIDLDRRNKLVFWADILMSKVERVDYHGNNRKQLYQQSGVQFFGLTLFYSYLYTSGWRTNVIYKMNAFNTNATVVNNITVGNGHTWGLVHYDISRQSSGMYITFISFSDKLSFFLIDLFSLARLV